MPGRIESKAPLFDVGQEAAEENVGIGLRLAGNEVRECCCHWRGAPGYRRRPGRPLSFGDKKKRRDLWGTHLIEV